MRAPAASSGHGWPADRASSCADYKQNGININTAQDGGFCAAVYTGASLTGGQASQYNWYQTYCTKPGKACMVAESGAAYHPNDDNGQASQMQIQQAWWQDCITNEANFNQFPRIKFHMHFEYQKMESDGGVADLRDYRITNVTSILNAFKADLAGVQQNYLWCVTLVPTRFLPDRLADHDLDHRATYVPVPSGVATTGPGISAPTSLGASGTSGSTATGPTLVMQTVRDPAITAPPTLFGQLLSGSWKVAVPWLATMGTSTGLGFWLVGRRSL